VKDLAMAIGLLFFIEGLIVAIFPSKIKNMLKSIDKFEDQNLRKAGIFFLILGFLIVWYIKN
tara:strand:- start:192 stop:377 length:186 start_codon:yes stop_codon:yes gene_type:complete